MNTKPTRVFDFVLRDGKISPEMSGATAYFYFSTYGLPIEEYIGEFKKKWSDMTPDERMELISHDLKEWHKE